MQQNLKKKSEPEWATPWAHELWDLKQGLKANAGRGIFGGR